jgi:glutaredoxin
MKVDIYSKPHCSLCEQAKAALERVRARLPFELREVDIRSDPDLLERHRYDIPVVLVDGEVVFRHRVDEARLEELLRGWSPTGTPVAQTGSRSE